MQKCINWDQGHDRCSKGVIDSANGYLTNLYKLEMTIQHAERKFIYEK